MPASHALIKGMLEALNTTYLVAGLIISAIPVIHYPFGWFETLFHELSHGLAAIFTGGSIESIALDLDGAGLCATSGGNGFLILVLGYTGSALWGSLVYLSVSLAKAGSAKIIALILAIIVVFVSILWARDIITLGILLVIIGLFYAAYLYGSHQSTRYFVEFIGIYVVLNAIRSPLSLVDGRDIGDGGALSEMTRIPEIIWIMIWSLFAVACLMLLYFRSVKNSRCSTV
ncbi:MAG: M50 family metallopeptidase [Candidatus Thiodiazotropha sp. (ex Epidulcina cf. delphinae)]|nr:M50 family metallopeptidase [Candidatus Thiodiazotropha sp. (ex Epidulcina cf. delphinae)]